MEKSEATLVLFSLSHLVLVRLTVIISFVMLNSSYY